MKMRWISKIAIGIIAVMSILVCGGCSMFKQINEEKSFTIDAIDEIQVNMTSEAVHIIRGEAGSEVKFRLYGKSMQEVMLAAQIKNEKVVVDVHMRQFIPRDLYLDITIPKDYAKKLSIVVLSGAVRMDALDLESFSLSTLSGKLEAETINAKKVYLKSTSGKLSVNKLDAEELDISGLSCAINVDACKAKEARMETASGSISLKNCSGNLAIKTKSGKVTVDYKEFEQNNIKIEALSGSVVLALPTTAEFSLEERTTSGKIVSDFPQKTGTKSNRVMLQTLSGNIKIVRK